MMLSCGLHLALVLQDIHDVRGSVGCVRRRAQRVLLHADKDASNSTTFEV